jgi:hypothetical protein
MNTKTVCKVLETKKTSLQDGCEPYERLYIRMTISFF